jgi:hypothetical protein
VRWVFVPVQKEWFPGGLHPGSWRHHWLCLVTRSPLPLVTFCQWMTQPGKLHNVTESSLKLDFSVTKPELAESSEPRTLTSGGLSSLTRRLATSWKSPNWQPQHCFISIHFPRIVTRSIEMAWASLKRGFAVTSIGVDLKEGVHQNDARIIAKLNTAHDFNTCAFTFVKVSKLPLVSPID